MHACVRACVLILYKPVLAINLTFRFFGLRSFWSQRGQHRFDAPTPERGASPQPPAPRRSSNHPTTNNNNKTKSQKIRIRNQNQKGATASSHCLKCKRERENAKRAPGGEIAIKAYQQDYIIYIIFCQYQSARAPLCARILASALSAGTFHKASFYFAHTKPEHTTPKATTEQPGKHQLHPPSSPD